MTPSEFQFVVELLRRESGIVLEPGKEYLVDARLAPLQRQEGFASLAELLAAVNSPRGEKLKRQLVSALTTNETSFFRDATPFEVLKTDVLPGLIEEQKAKRELSIWSAACSTGQELYSILMLLHENFPSLLDWRLTLHGTDLSAEVVDRARGGIFSQIEINRGLPAPLLIKYFKKSESCWQIDDSLRRRARFEEMNLTREFPHMPQMNIVFLRNVLIYFEPETKRQILDRVKKVLAPGGYLFLGAAETTIGIDDSFEVKRINKYSCYQLAKSRGAKG